METIINKLEHFDNLSAMVITALGITFKDDVMIAQDNTEMSWEDMEYLALPTPIEYQDGIIDGILIFGDMTIEFHDKDTQEGFNWADFPIEIIDKVTDSIQMMLIKC